MSQPTGALAVPASGEFPLEFLHAEMVGFFIGEEEDCAKKDEAEMASCSEGQQIAMKRLVSSAMGKVNGVTKLEFVGYRVGYGLVERVARQLPRFPSELDCVKFLCKDFWSAVFQKQVDNLRTNHQGVYVLQDNRFRFVASLGGATGETATAQHVAFSCGMLRGALANIGLRAVVTAAVDAPPAVKFNVHMQH